VKHALLDKLELKIPPPLLALACALAMWLAARTFPSLALPLPWHPFGAGALLLAGAALDLCALFTFLRARTTINPLKPEATTQLVIVGLYRYSRNPMYVGLLLTLAGWAVWLANAAALPVLAVFVGWLNRFQIAPEERCLAERFGAQYAAYRRSVRRWL